MSKLPDDITSVRINKKSYMKFKEFCEERGLLAPKQVGFLLEGLMKNSENFELIKAGWKILELEKKKRETHVLGVPCKFADHVNVEDKN